MKYKLFDLLPHEELNTTPLRCGITIHPINNYEERQKAVEILENAESQGIYICGIHMYFNTYEERTAFILRCLG